MARRLQSTLWAPFRVNKRPRVAKKSGPGKGIGGFASIAPGALGPGSPAVDVHTLGNSTAKEEVGGPGSMKPEHACDGKGIDYLEACLAG